MLTKFVLSLKCLYYRKLFEKQIDFHRKNKIFHRLFDDVIFQQQNIIEPKDLRLTFGEIAFYPFLTLLNTLKPNPSDIFIDLGSGHGKACVAAALGFEIHKCIGIELLPERHAVAQSVYEQCPDYLQEQLQFICADFTECSIQQATIIFINATGFFNDDWKKVQDFLINKTQPNCKLIISSKQLPLTHFELIAQHKIHMQYGPSHINLYSKR
jgi:trans-aconitate methyltransferase